jgi:hypothetical protein
VRKDQVFRICKRARRMVRFALSCMAASVAIVPLGN